MARLLLVPKGCLIITFLVCPLSACDGGLNPGLSLESSTAKDQPVALEKVFHAELEPFNIPSGKSCGVNAYVIGVSQGLAMLCVNDGFPIVPQGPEAKVTVAYHDPMQESPRYGGANPKVDWAVKRQKLECPAGYMITGLVNDAKTDTLGNRWPNLGVMCTQATARLLELDASECRTVWFDRKTDNRVLDGSDRDQDFHEFYVKGQCRRGEYDAGLAYSDSFIRNSHRPNALLCCHERTQGQ